MATKYLFKTSNYFEKLLLYVADFIQTIFYLLWYIKSYIQKVACNISWTYTISKYKHNEIQNNMVLIPLLLCGSGLIGQYLDDNFSIIFILN